MTTKQIQEAAFKAAVNISRIYDQNAIRYGFQLGANFVQSQSQWIPVTERLPEEGKKVLWLDKDGSQYVESLINEKYDYDRYDWYFKYCSHWRTLPEPPKAEKL